MEGSRCLNVSQSLAVLEIRNVRYFSPLLLILFLMGNAEWIDSPLLFFFFQQTFMDLKNITVIYLSLILNQINFWVFSFRNLYHFKLFSFGVSPVGPHWSGIAVMKIRQCYSWGITSMQGFKNAKSDTSVYTSWYIVFMLLIQASSGLSSCFHPFLLFCHPSFPEAPAKVCGTAPSCCSRLTVAVIRKKILLKDNRQSFWPLTKWQAFGEEALEVFAVHSQ